jgi:sucrose phosphorylase
VKRLVELINFRNTHPAFNCDFQVLKTDQNHLALLWEGEEARAMLTVDLLRMKAKIEYSGLEGINRVFTP